MEEENFDYFEQQAIMNGSISPSEIIAKRNKLEDLEIKEVNDAD